MSLSKNERFFLISILETQNMIKKDSNIDLKIEALREGYLDFYSEEIDEMPEDFPKNLRTEVMDALDMYEDIQKHDPSKHFPGYDGNDPTESRMMSYVAFLRKNNRWSHLSVIKENINSHFSMRNTYQKMIEKWKGKGKKLNSKDDVKDLFNT